MHRFVTLCTVSHLAAGEHCVSDVYGCIYIPDGHPLRGGTAKNVRKYFWGASTRRDATTIDKCTQCTAPVYTEEDAWDWSDAPEIE